MRAWTAKNVEALLETILEEVTSEDGMESGDTLAALRRNLYQIKKERERDEGHTVAERVDGRVILQFPAEAIPGFLSTFQLRARDLRCREKNTKNEKTLERLKAWRLEVDRAILVLGDVAER